MLTDRITGLKTEIICDSMDEIEENAIIPVDFDRPPTKSPMTVMNLGKLLLQYCKEGETSKVHELMCRGAPFSTDWLGTSPIHLAAMNNHLDTCEVLLRAGISKDARTKVDRTPLHFAVFEGHEKMVELLLANNCDVDARDMLKMTPLHWAVQKKHKEIVEMLLNNNADPNAISKFGKTPLLIAHETEQEDVLKTLELVIRLRLNTKDQTQEATERLVFEMQQSSVNNNNDSVDNNISTPIDLDSEDSSTLQFNMAGQIQTNHINNLDDSNLIDSDDGTSLSDAIIQLQNIEEPKTIDASTLQMLKDHGISMLPTDDTDNSLITSALQSGRKLVLSEAGKIILTDPKFRKLTQQHDSHNQQNQLQTSLNLAQKKQPLILPAKNFPIKSNKVIKILSAEQFKQMCGGNTLKKFTYENNSPGIKTSTATTKSQNILQLTPQKFKRPVMQKNRLNINSLAKATNLKEVKPATTSSTVPLTLQQQIVTQPNNINNEFITTGTTISLPQTGKEIRNKNYTDMPTIANTNGITKNNLLNGIIINFNNKIKQQTDEEVQEQEQQEQEQQPPSLTWLDMERQILELKKANEEIKRQFEISQKINEDFRIRLVKLERERELEKNSNS